MAGAVITLTSSSTGGTAWASGTALRTDVAPQLDYTKYGGTTIASVVTTSGAGLTYNIEWSNDSPVLVSSITGSSQQTWFSSGSSALSTNAYVSLAFPVRSVRINVTTGTSLQSVTATIIQSQL